MDTWTLEMLLLSIPANGDAFSGYEISAFLAEPIPLMWPVKHNRIYPALAVLEERGDVVGDWILQSGRPSKEVYIIFPDGVECLRAWLLEPRTSLSQDEVRLIAYNLDLLGNRSVAEALAIYREQRIREKRLLEERWLNGRKYPWADRAGGKRMMGIRFLYEHAFAVKDAQIIWCDEGLARAEAAVEHAR